MHSDSIPGLVGGDWNCHSSATVPLADGGRAHYDSDPYPRASWHPDHVYQLDDLGRVDRTVAHRLESALLGRMRDCALLAGVPWAPTTGHHPADRHPARRIDRWYATWHLPDAAVTGHRTLEASIVGESTDHLPVLVDLDAKRLSTTLYPQT